MKLDKRKNYYLILDTETCPKMPLDEVKPFNMLVYDIGWQVADIKGNVYVKRSFIVDEIFYGEREKMKSAYYYNKIAQYEEDIKNGSRIVAPFKAIQKYLEADIETLGVCCISVHFARCDDWSLNSTKWWLANDRSDCYPLDVKLYDTLSMARDTICQYKTYNYYTPNGDRKSATAENLYKYITHNTEFIESHTALEDVEIETEILIRCLKSHRKMRKEYQPKTGNRAR